MRVCTATLESLSPLCQSRFHNTPKLEKESHDDYEKRTWREKLRADDSGNVVIPPMSLKFAIDDAAKRLRMRIPGKGQSEYGKLLAGGVMVMDGLTLNVKKDDVEGQWLHLNADGRRGGGTRVMRCIPTIPKWKGEMVFYIIDDAIPNDVFEYHLNQAGMIVGIGQHRPGNGGFCGRFKVVKTKWTNQ